MKNEWILNVLADLEAFARQNEMAALAMQLDETRLLAALELARSGAGASDGDADDRKAPINAGLDLRGPGKRV